LHVDLTPAGDTRGALVNKGSAECIEIWNLVFIQFNANPDGTFSPLPAKHVDTGMGFERVTSIIQGTKDFTDFANAKISNYETDIFRPIFDEIEKLCGKTYRSTLPQPDAAGQIIPTSEQEKIDVAFRVIADHIRTLSFSIADNIQPGNSDRNYVLRRILRRAVRYGRTLGFNEPFFYKLAAVLARTMGDIFPEIRAKQKHVEEVLKREEESFNKTLDKGIELFEREVVRMTSGQISGAFAFRLYDEQGFPLDLTELMARERGLSVDLDEFKRLMQKQRDTATEANEKRKVVIELSQVETKTPTHFIGYDHNHTGADVQEMLSLKGKTVVIANNSVCYAEMGGQVGDTGEMTGHGGNSWRIANTQKSGNTWLHFLEETDGPAVGEHVTIQVDLGRRNAIQRHHTVTHLLHWALHEVVSHEATQKGSFVGPDKLTFDFNSAALTPGQVRDIERLVNERIVENTGVSWIEVPYAGVRGRPDIMQFFGDKYGETVRVVQIGGHAAGLDGYSMELCAGTHTRATGEIGLFRINAESAIAAGVRRIEAVAGLHAYDLANADTQRLHALAVSLGTPLPELEKRVEGLLAQQKELEKALKAAQQREAAGRAKDLLATAATINGTPAIIANLGAADGDTLQTVADALKSHGFKGVTVLGGTANGAVALVASVSSDFTAQAQAGKIIQAIAPMVGGKGGGKPEGARGGGKDPAQLDAALAHAKTLLG
jgi:alanyl-tRNA synthetase